MRRSMRPSSPMWLGAAARPRGRARYRGLWRQPPHVPGVHLRPRPMPARAGTRGSPGRPNARTGPVGGRGAFAAPLAGPDRAWPFPGGAGRDQSRAGVDAAGIDLAGDRGGDGASGGGAGGQGEVVVAATGQQEHHRTVRGLVGSSVAAGGGGRDRVAQQPAVGLDRQRHPPAQPGDIGARRAGWLGDVQPHHPAGGQARPQALEDPPHPGHRRVEELRVARVPGQGAGGLWAQDHAVHRPGRATGSSATPLRGPVRAVWAGAVWRVWGGAHRVQRSPIHRHTPSPRPFHSRPLSRSPS